MHKSDAKKIRFKCAFNELCHIDTRDEKKDEACVVDTVKENRKGYSKRQCDCAVRAKKMHHMAQTLSVKDFKRMIVNSQMTNCSVTLKDVKIAKKIFGFNTSSVKEKETRKKPISVISDQIELLKKLSKRHGDVISCVNVVFIDELAFFVTISIDVEYRTVECIAN